MQDCRDSKDNRYLELALAAGATAIYEEHPLQRAFQDIHVISQHLQARRAHYELVGRYWLGLGIEDARF